MPNPHKRQLRDNSKKIASHFIYAPIRARKFSNAPSCPPLIAPTELLTFLTTPLHPPPFLLLPPLKKLLFAQRLAMGMIRVGLMMPGKVLQIALVSVVSGKTAHDLPE
jgi:hypothetical protein